MPKSPEYDPNQEIEKNRVGGEAMPDNETRDQRKNINITISSDEVTRLRELVITSIEMARERLAGHLIKKTRFLEDATIPAEADKRDLERIKFSEALLEKLK